MRIACQVMMGTVIYAFIVVFAASLPTAAGLMLTFPALNGLAFFYSPPASAAPMARTMLWLPIVNGALCAAYILLFPWLEQSLSATAAAFSLAVLVTALWLFLVTRERLRRGIAADHQFWYCLTCTLTGALLAWMAVRFVTDGLQLFSPDPPSMLDILRRNSVKIVLFAVCLGAFLVATVWLPIRDWVRGILAGLPLVPFGGLLSIAADPQMTVTERGLAFRAMAASIWLAPAFAVWFIYGISRFLNGRTASRSPSTESLIRFAGILVGWVLCFGAIVLGTYAIQAL
jgi:hypothetical protein